MSDRALLKSSRARKFAFQAADKLLNADPLWPRPECEREDYNRDVAKPVLAGGTVDLDVLVNGADDA